MIRDLFFTFVCSFFIGMAAITAGAQGTDFSYQGSLRDGVNPANADYDLEFALFDALTAGAQLGTTLARNGVAVTKGIFAVSLDFGAQFPGANRFLEIRVRQTGGGTFTTLAPRQAVSSSPYSIKSINAETAANAGLATNAQQLAGIAASQYVLTGDARLSDARQPLAGSASYIQNQNAVPQATSNFDISGTGRAAAFNAVTQFSIGGNRVLSAPVTSNIFVGVGAGNLTMTGTFNSFVGLSAGDSNTTGSNNAFFGQNAGQANTTGGSNSFFGETSGFSNTIGFANSFFGGSAGLSTTTGTDNTFVGREAGMTNSTGSNNTAIGANANFGANNLTFATAIGSGSTVAASNTVAVGRAADTVQVPGIFNVAGTFTGNIVNAATRYDLGGSRVLSNAGTNNLFAGVDSGTANSGTFNSFFGTRAGQANTAGFSNSFFGANAGLNNTTGGSNTFLGVDTGPINTTGGGNAFVGQSAGFNNTMGSSNAFVGNSSGFGNLSGSGNAFFGASAGLANTTGSNNTAVGSSSNVSNGALTFATAIGSLATVSTSNTIALGRSSGLDTVSVPGSLNVGGSSSFTGTVDANVYNAALQYNIGSNRVLSVLGTGNTFAGVGTGALIASGHSNSFFGRDAGTLNTTGSSNSFFGRDAGAFNTSGFGNAFFGTKAGQPNQTGFHNSFFGFQTGISNTIGGNNAYFGANAGFFSSGSNNSFFGTGAGDNNGTGSSNTIIGHAADVGINALTFATALGSFAVVETNDTIVLGKVAGTYNLEARPADAVVVPGHLYREYTAVARSAATPLAYGSISGTGTILSGTGNFTLVHTGPGLYDITITGETYSNGAFTVTITPVTNTPRITAVADVGTAFRINMWDLAGTFVDNAFQFTIWTVDPN